MLAAVIGPGNAVVRVSAEIETEATTESEKYDPEGQVVRNQTQTDDTTNTTEARAGGGAAGVSANVPEKAAGAAESARPISTSEQNRKNRPTPTRSTRSSPAPRAIAGVGPQRHRGRLHRPAYGVPRRGPMARPGFLRPRCRSARSRSSTPSARSWSTRSASSRAGPDARVAGLAAGAAVPGRAPNPRGGGGRRQGGRRIQGWLEVRRQQLGSRWRPGCSCSWSSGACWPAKNRRRCRWKSFRSPAEAAAVSRPNSPNSVTPELLNELIRQKPATSAWRCATGSPTAPAARQQELRLHRPPLSRHG
jgi:flagellar M-ring protein FliF